MRQHEPFAALPLTRRIGLPFITSVVTAALLALTAGVGLLLGQQGFYRPDPHTLPAFLAQDAITLLFGLPLLLVSLWTARNGSLRGFLLWMAALFYFAYSYAYYLLSPEFNALYLAYIAIVSMSGYGLLYLLLSTDTLAVKDRFSQGTRGRIAAGFLIVMSLLMGMKWVTAIVGSLAGGPSPTPVDLGVYPMDLVIAFPAMFWGGIWLWRKEALGFVVGAVLLVKAAAVGLGLVAASWVVTFSGVPMDPMLPAYAVIGLGGTGLAVLYLRGVKPDRCAEGERSNDPDREPIPIRSGIHRRRA
jgi:hypothetical protein